MDVHLLKIDSQVHLGKKEFIFFNYENVNQYSIFQALSVTNTEMDYQEK